MKLEELKSGLFGYQKADVYQYITSLEEEFSQKLVEKDEEHRRLTDQYLHRIRRLEEEVERLKRQCEEQQSDQLRIADTLLDARRYREILQQETQRMEQEARDRLQERLEEERAQLDRYSSQIKKLRKLFCLLLQEMEEDAEELEFQAGEIREPDWAGEREGPSGDRQALETFPQQPGPQGNMTLFRRKAGTATV